MSDIRPVVFSFASNPDDPRVKRLTDSCAKWGWTLSLQTGHWPGDFQFWTNFFSSLDGYRAQRFTHVVRVDAFDVAAVGPPSELADSLAFHHNPAVLISAECAAWPNDYRKAEYPDTPHPWKYAHSPLTIDLWQPIDPQFFQIPDRGYGADQLWFADCILNKMHGIAIDRECKVVQSLGHCHPWQEFFAIEGDRVRNKLTRSLPAFVHYNGGQCVPEWVP